jgi:protein MpaA
VVPALNIDGVLRSTRVNARGVDLNRNMATNDWSPEVATPRYHPGPSANSEPETLALVNWLLEHKPCFILSMHSWKPLLNVNGACLREAEVIAKWTGYAIQESIGYPTPGCLGTYCGLERDMPTLTYEIERGLATEEILRLHVPAIVEGLKVTESMRQKSL